MFTTNNINGFSVKAYRGDAKTLLAFNMPSANTKDLAGFTICCTPQGNPSYYLFNALQFEKPELHFQDLKEPAFSSVNAPYQKFQWLHSPGQFHQGNKIFYGFYDYTVTPRFFKDGKLQQINDKFSVTVNIEVSSFSKNTIELGFTRGFVQSQAFVHRFGVDAKISPTGEKNAFFNTSDIAGNIGGKSFSFQDEYVWSGFTAREKIFSILEEVTKDKTLRLDIFAYDLYEPDFSTQVFHLAKEGRVRIILDNALLHHDNTNHLAEDQFESQFKIFAINKNDIKRGKFSRFSHDKVMVVSKGKIAKKVLTGSTNFSVTGMYVNSNHVVIFNDQKVAQAYSDVFEESWNTNVSIAFASSPYANQTFSFSTAAIAKLEINFSPHPMNFATTELQKMADRVLSERKSVLFAVMDVSDGSGPLLSALQTIHASGKVFSFGISDSPKNNLTLYKPGITSGVLVSGKISGELPPPFDKEKNIGLGHQIHHKFIVCDFNGTDAVVYCGSSNLAEGGEEQNGDNLIAIYDTDIATVFAIEAIGLVDHFNFRNTFGTNNHPANANAVNNGKKLDRININSNLETSNKNNKMKTSKMLDKLDKNIGETKDSETLVAAPLVDTSAHRPMTLVNNSNWANSYFSEFDTHCQERSLLG